MREIIRSGGVGRCALAIIVLTGSLVIQPPATGQDASKSEAPKEAVAGPSSVPPATAAVTQDATPQTAAPQTAGPQTSAPAPDSTEPKAKGKSSAKNTKNAKSSAPGQVTAGGVQKETYVIGPEDILGLNVLHQPDVSQMNLEVRPDGFVSVRFAGEIRAAGLTTQQLSDAITEKLKTYFNNPEVNIQVQRINSKKYYMSGGVKKPGLYPLTAPKTVYEALIEAGGLNDFAKKTKIYVLRGQQKFSFNYKEVSKGTHLEQNILLQNGDVVTVPE
jgi:polysaccharide export outer membrane protein